MRIIKINTEYITLGQFLKFIGIVDRGSETKTFLSEENVLINNEPETRRGRKLYNGYQVLIQGINYLIESQCST